MFYKVKGVSKKTKMGTVYAILRTGKGETLKETVKTTRVSVNPAHFNAKTGKVSSKDPLHIEKNEQIHLVGSDMEEVARTLASKGVQPSKASVSVTLAEKQDAKEYVEEKKVDIIKDLQGYREKLLKLVQDYEAKISKIKADIIKIETTLEMRPEAVLFSKQIQDYREVKRKENVKASTIKNYKVLENIVYKYNPVLELTDMNLEFFQDFQTHLVDRGVTNKSIREILGKLKSVFKYYANKTNIPTGFLSEFKMVKEGEPNDVLFLTPEELSELEALVIPNTNVGQTDVRNQFLFAVETGLRRSDYNVSKANIKGNDLVVATKKTGKVASIPFTSKAHRIFKDNNYNFRVIREAQFNQTLRAICKKLPSMHKQIIVTKYVGAEAISEPFEKWELMSSHVARKTYAENALAKGADIIAVAEWLGHKSTKMLEQHYANKKQIAKREAHKMRD